MDWNSALVVYDIVTEWGAILIHWPSYLQGTKVNNNWYLMIINNDKTTTH